MTQFEVMTLVFEIVVSVVLLGFVPWAARVIREIATLNTNMSTVLAKLDETGKDVARVDTKVENVDRRLTHVEATIATIAPHRGHA